MIHDVRPQGALTGALDSICPKNHGDVRLCGSMALAKGRVHEVLGASADLFAFTVAASVTGPLVWVGLGRDLDVLSPAGCQNFVDPGRIILTQGVSRNDVLWAGEQALRSPGIACVVIDIERGPDLTESRRLQLAAEESGAIGLILISGRAHTSAAETRWRSEAIASDQATWEWECLKHRRGETGIWRVRWLGDEYGSDIIHMAAATAA